MNRLIRNLGMASLGLLALALLGGFPGPAAAAGIGLRNDLNVRVVVQGASVVNNVVRRGQPLVIDPGKTLWDTNLPMGKREIIVYAVQPNRILCRKVIDFQNQDMMLHIVTVPPGRVDIISKKSADK